MVLSNIEIRAEIDAKRLLFDPPIPDEPTANQTNRIGSSSVDLLLHDELIVLPSRVSGVIIDPTASRVDVMSLLRSNGRTQSLNLAPFQMEPNQLVIGKTLETIELPPHVAARIEGRSTLARLGLAVHVTAPTVLAGFKGRLYLEMHNIGPFTIQLRPEMPIAQLILERVGLPPTTIYGGQYQLQE